MLCSALTACHSQQLVHAQRSTNAHVPAQLVQPQRQCEVLPPHTRQDDAGRLKCGVCRAVAPHVAVAHRDSCINFKLSRGSFNLAVGQRVWKRYLRQRFCMAWCLQDCAVGHKSDDRLGLAGR